MRLFVRKRTHPCRCWTGVIGGVEVGWRCSAKEHNTPFGKSKTPPPADGGVGPAHEEQGGSAQDSEYGLNVYRTGPMGEAMPKPRCYCEGCMAGHAHWSAGMALDTPSLLSAAANMRVKCPRCGAPQYDGTFTCGGCAAQPPRSLAERWATRDRDRAALVRKLAEEECALPPLSENKETQP